MIGDFHYYVSCFHERVVKGDILSKDHFVVPIKTGGKSYGAISKSFVQRFPTVKLPVLEYGQVYVLPLDYNATRTVTFVAYWNEESEYTSNFMSLAANRAVDATSRYADKIQGEQGLPKDSWILSMPLFKGAEFSTENIASIEKEIQKVDEILDENFQIAPCEVEIVVMDTKRVPGFKK